MYRRTRAGIAIVALASLTAMAPATAGKSVPSVVSHDCAVHLHSQGQSGEPPLAWEATAYASLTASWDFTAAKIEFTYLDTAGNSHTGTMFSLMRKQRDADLHIYASASAQPETLTAVTAYDAKSRTTIWSGASTCRLDTAVGG